MKRLLLCVPAVLLVAACSSGGTSASAPTNVPQPIGGSTTAASAPAASPSASISPSPSPSPSASASPSLSPSPSASASSAVRPCGDGALSVSTAELDGGLSHSGVILVFTNSATTACSVTGYPGAAGLDAAGKQLVQATRTPSGYLGGVPGTAPVVVLAPGAVASARIEGVSAAPNNSQCPKVTGLLVTPPGSHVSTKLGTAPAACQGLQIHPVVAGKTGSMHA